jgi:hypothetical protein
MWQDRIRLAQLCQVWRNKLGAAAGRLQIGRVAADNPAIQLILRPCCRSFPPQDVCICKEAWAITP